MKKGSAKCFYEKHKKEIWIGVGPVTVAVVGYVVYRRCSASEPIKCQLKRNVNSQLAGKRHPITSVPFVQKNILCENRIIENFVGPEFDGIKIDLGMTKAEAWEQLGGTQKRFYNGTMKLAIDKLREVLVKTPSMASELGLTSNEVEDILKGSIPSGKTMHHCPETGRYGTIIMQYVVKKIHDLTAHTGGSTTLNPAKFIY